MNAKVHVHMTVSDLGVEPVKVKPGYEVRRVLWRRLS